MTMVVMPIHAYLDPEHYFAPNTVKAMGEAFEAACAFVNMEANEPKRREVIARLIITLARADNKADASALRDRAIKLLSDAGISGQKSERALRRS
jgi:hypothetical protein